MTILTVSLSLYCLSPVFQINRTIHMSFFNLCVLRSLTVAPIVYPVPHFFRLYCSYHKLTSIFAVRFSRLNVLHNAVVPGFLDVRIMIIKHDFYLMFSLSAFSSSVGDPSTPGALPSCKFFKALSNSSLVISGSLLSATTNS